LKIKVKSKKKKQYSALKLIIPGCKEIDKSNSIGNLNVEIISSQNNDLSTSTVVWRWRRRCIVLWRTCWLCRFFYL